MSRYHQKGSVVLAVRKLIILKKYYYQPKHFFAFELFSHFYTFFFQQKRVGDNFFLIIYANFYPQSNIVL